jgi:LysM repeat protein
MKRFLSTFLQVWVLLACATGWALDAYPQGEQPSGQEQFWEYTFRPGDSLWKIADEYTTSPNNWQAIQKINAAHLAPDRQIPPGTRLQIPVRLLKNPPTPARVIAVSGEVVMFRAAGTREAVRIGSLLYSGDRVVTGGLQSLRIQFADDSELQVQPDSDVIMDKLSHHRHTGMVDTRIRLNTGRVNTRVKKQQSGSRYEIMTPAALTAVRGTAFRLVSGRDNISRLEVSEGRVAVLAGGQERAVDEGFGLVAEPGKPLPAPVKLLEATGIGDNQDLNRYALIVEWQALAGASAYRYLLASDASFDRVLFDEVTAQTRLELSGLQAGAYYLRVRGIDKAQLEGTNSERRFDIMQKPVRDNASKLERILPGTLLLIQ